jgi:hypothetical protein
MCLCIGVYACAILSLNDFNRLWAHHANEMPRSVHLCHAPLHEECPQRNGHKGDPGMTPEICGASDEMDQVILVWMTTPGV